MSLTIHKFVVEPGTFTLELPVNAKPLCVQMQHGQPQMWVLLNPELNSVSRRFAVIGTGHKIDPQGLNRMQYIGTFQPFESFMVWHLFEVGG